MERNFIEGSNNNNSNPGTKEVVGLGGEKKGRPQEQLNCPRCNSTNTKFCYYNNYSLTQPRYFCKTCRRYWTEGGSLRNVPVGGGSRKNKKLFTNNPNSSSSTKVLPDLNPPTTSTSSSQNPKLLMQGGQDLNLAFPPINVDNYHHGLTYQSSSSSTSALALLRAGMNNNNQAFVHNPILMMPNSNNNNNNNGLFPASGGFISPIMHEVKPGSLGFSVADNHQGLRGGSRYGSVHHHQENSDDNNINAGGARLLFPFGDVKQIPEENKEHAAGNNSSTSGYWTGMIGEGSW
ncbi:hypothetical protein K1719_026905 [Acacia pycnantha]|nr:hypothetical protein K1719_026905 [Acacia pycnantha]